MSDVDGDLLRRLAPQVLTRLLRRHGSLDECEDAVQEALVAAARQWPVHGAPDDPLAWLVTVATRRHTDAVRADAARRGREAREARRDPGRTEPDEPQHAPEQDDTLTLLFLCCHPSLTLPSQVALTLRAVGGLTTDEIARSFLVPSSTMGQRISRAKQRIKASGATFAPPAPHERAARLTAVLHVLFLVFNEGHTASAGVELQRVDLVAEALRLTRELHARAPREGEVMGLLALMLLTDSRRDARTTATGDLVPLDEQDRMRWRRDLIDEGVALVSDALATTPIGPFQVQAAIAAVHAEAATPEDTDWPQILALYGVLARLAPSPVVELNRAVAVAMVHGTDAGLAIVDRLAADPALALGHRLDVVRGHLEERRGNVDAARDAYRRAARRTTSRPEQRHLDARAARLDGR